MESTTALDKKPPQINFSFVDSSKKRKRNQLKGPSNYGIPFESKKQKLDENGVPFGQEENKLTESPAIPNLLVSQERNYHFQQQ